MRNNDILVDLDSLLDFRLAVMAKINDEYAASLLDDSHYIDRNRDDEFFLPSGCTVEEYNAAYDQRTTTYQQLTPFPTAVYWLLGKIISSKFFYSDRPVTHNRVTLVINDFPYSLSEKGKSALIAAVGIYLDTKIEIRVESYGINDLTPDFLKSRFKDVVIYDFDSWDRWHRKAYMENPMPTVAIHTPAIMRGTKLSEIDQGIKEEIGSGLNGMYNPFVATAFQLSDYLDLRFVDTRHFSVELKRFPVGGN